MSNQVINTHKSNNQYTKQERSIYLNKQQCRELEKFTFNPSKRV